MKTEYRVEYELVTSVKGRVVSTRWVVAEGAKVSSLAVAREILEERLEAVSWGGQGGSRWRIVGRVIGDWEAVEVVDLEGGLGK